MLNPDLELALAGFRKRRSQCLTQSMENFVVEGQKEDTESESRTFIHKGLAQQKF
jgi:HSP20 family molecular chaperone IbpA